MTSKLRGLYRRYAPRINTGLRLLHASRSLYTHAPKIIYSGVVDLRGTPRERGIVHGRLFRSIIPDLIQRNLCNPLGPVSRALLESYRRELIGFYSDNAPQLVEEMTGIAAGAEVDFSRVFDYNVLAILLLDLFSRPESCTSIRLRTPSRQTIHAGTLDSGQSDGSYLVKRVMPDNGQSYVGGMVVGTTWTTFGMNSAGLTIGGSSVNPVRKDQKYLEGLDSDNLTSYILESASSVQAAKQILGKFPAILPLNSGNNLIVSDLNGCMLAEIHGRDRNYVVPPGDLLLSTNHFADKMSPHNAHDSVLVEKLHSASVARLHAMQDHFRDPNKYSPDGIKQILRSHKQPGAICRHYGRDGELGQTTISYMMIPSEKRTYCWISNPCKSRPMQVELA